ncbi:hypothetical protein [uncultured Eubacterium sp.]|uniref:hypothetical protein n=1 Tax=uncultured Eubacterium sp. TaxID=165185 RepID=UPI002613593C|nr:hypothetical protein [uncultured Eubacterium sp.]
MKDMTITAGRVYAGMSKISKAKQELKNKLQEIYSDTKLSDEGKKEYELLWRNKYEETCKKANEDMQEAVNELQNAVVTDEFRPSQEMRDTIDFVETMKAGGCLSDRVLNEQLSKFKGQEMNLIYMREKLKDCIGTDVFDKYTFSGYSKGDIDKPAQFIPPDRYFNQLRESLEKEDNTTTSYMLNGLEERLGIESAEGKQYKTERQASIIGTSQLI